MANYRQQLPIVRGFYKKTGSFRRIAGCFNRVVKGFWQAVNGYCPAAGSLWGKAGGFFVFAGRLCTRYRWQRTDVLRPFVFVGRKLSADFWQRGGGAWRRRGDLKPRLRNLEGFVNVKRPSNFRKVRRCARQLTIAMFGSNFPKVLNFRKVRVAHHDAGANFPT